MKNLKLISTILLSLMLMFTLSTAVFADNETDDIWSNNVEVIGEGNNTTDNNTLNEATNNTNTDLEDENEVESEVEDLDNEVENNSSTTNSSNLAYTGIGDSNGIIALIVVISAIVAIYSAKKFNDYKNI